MDTPIIQFDAIKWINCHFEKEDNLDKERQEPVLCFSLMWNMFETAACRRQADPISIRNSVDHVDAAGRLRRDKYIKIIKYFQDRYGTSEQNLDSCLERLLMTDRRSQEEVRRAIKGETQDLNPFHMSCL